MLSLAGLCLSFALQEPWTTSGPSAEFARRLEVAVAKGETIVLDMAMDADAFYDRVVGSAKLSPALVRFYKPMIRMSFTSIPYFGTLKGRVTFKFLRVRKSEDGDRALFRLTGKGGAYNYHELLLVPDQDRFRITDYLVLNFGGFQSELVRNSTLPSPKTLELLNEMSLPTPMDFMMDFGSNPLNLLSQELAAGQHQKALETYDKHEATLKKFWIAHVLRVNAARMVGQAAFEKALGEMGELVKSGPTLDIAATSGYLEFGLLEKALNAIDRLDGSIGGDPFLNVLRGNAYLAAKDAAKARVFLRKATDQEPTLDQGWWPLIAAHLALKDFKEVVRCLDLAEKNLEVTFGDLSKIPDYSEFAASPEYAEWMKGRAPK